MMADNQSIGIMQGAFFVAKGQIITWINELLKINITRIEQLGTGAVYCQILDVMNPGKVPLQRVNFRAVNEWQFINNLKILQQGFAKCKILKHIDIQKLAKCKYQDNLQFIQWMKRHFQLYNKTDFTNYDPQAARKNAQVDFSFIQYRLPNKKQKKIKENEQPYVRGKSKSPYANVKSKINSRSITVGKSNKGNNNYYLDKLNEIKKIIQNKKGEDKLTKIQQIIKQIQEDINDDDNQAETKQINNMSSVVSKKVITPPKKKVKTLVN